MPQYFKKQLSPLIIALVLGLLAPTFCVLWFMLSAMESERIASLKHLEELYRREALDTLHALEKSWLQEWSLQANNQTESSPAIRFNALVSHPLIASSIIWDEKGRLAYPQNMTSLPAIPLSHPAWRRAQELEFSEKKYALAETFYTDILASETDHHHLIAVHQALSRLAYKMGNIDNAIAHQKMIIHLGKHDAIKKSLTESTARNTTVDATYRIFELLLEKNNNIDTEIIGQATELKQQLLDYKKIVMPASQRIFVMKLFNTKLLSSSNISRINSNLMIADDDILAETLAAHFSATQRKKTQFVAHKNNDYLRINRAYTSIFIARDLFEAEINNAMARKDKRSPLEFQAYNLQPHSNYHTRHFFSFTAEGIFNGINFEAHWKEDVFPDALANTRVAIYVFTGCTVIIALFLLYFFVVVQMRRQERLQQLRSDVIATISHELKTPLASIRLLIDNLEEGNYSLPAEVADYINIIKNENSRLSNLVDNFMIFSRIERDKHIATLETLSVKHLIEMSLAAVAKHFAAHNPTLSIESSVDELYIQGDESLLQTTLINLFDNAYKYSGDNKIIAIKSWGDEHNIFIAITDNGIGITEHDKQRIFDRFFRVDQRLSRRTEGCGLGLNICRHIIQKHGGNIRVDSTLGKGSTFTIQLPR